MIQMINFQVFKNWDFIGFQSMPNCTKFYVMSQCHSVEPRALLTFCQKHSLTTTYRTLKLTVITEKCAPSVNAPMTMIIAVKHYISGDKTETEC